MKRGLIIFLILLLFNNLIIFSLSKEILFLEKGSTHYIYEKSVNIRSKPSLKSNKIGRVIIGEEVKIIKKIDKKKNLHGLIANWYEVECKNKRGYIWGGLISNLETKGDFNRDGKEELVLSLCIGDGYASESMIGYQHKIKICRKGELLFDNPFETKIIDSSSLETIDSEGFFPFVPILEIKFEFEDGTTEGETETQLFYWYNNKFLLIDQFRCYYFLNSSDEIIPIFPDDKGGEKNIIKMERKVVKYEFDIDTYEEGDLIQDSIQIIRKYKWDGNTFNEFYR